MMFVLAILGLVLLALVVFAGPYIWARVATEDILRKWAKDRRLEIISIRITAYGARAPFHRSEFDERVVTFPGRAEVTIRHVLKGTETKGQLVWDVSGFGIADIEFTPSRVILPNQPALSGILVGGDIEARILAEANQRLDWITTRANWMEPYDLDESGQLDEDEWASLRGKIIDEVRSEFEAAEAATKVSVESEQEVDESW